MKSKTVRLVLDLWTNTKTLRSTLE